MLTAHHGVEYCSLGRPHSVKKRKSIKWKDKTNWGQPNLPILGSQAGDKPNQYLCPELCRQVQVVHGTTCYCSPSHNSAHTFTTPSLLSWCGGGFGRKKELKTLNSFMLYVHSSYTFSEYRLNWLNLEHEATPKYATWIFLFDVVTAGKGVRDVGAQTVLLITINCHRSWKYWQNWILRRFLGQKADETQTCMY